MNELNDGELDVDVDVGGETPPGTGVSPPPTASHGLPSDSLGAKVYAAMIQGGNPHLVALRHGHALNTYVAFCKANGWSLATAPADALTQCARATWKPGVGQNSSASAVMKALAIAEVPFNPQTYAPSKDDRPRKPRDVGNASVGNDNAGVGNGGPNGVGTVFEAVSFGAQRVPVEQFAPPTAVASGGGAATVHTVAPTPPTAPAPVPTARVQPVKNPLPQSARVRISKIATGYEGPGVSPGYPMTCGEYMADDIATEGSILNFLQRWVSPRFGPFAGHPDTTYRVERIDARGVALETWQFVIAAPAAGTGNGTPPQNGFGGQPPTPQPFTPYPQYGHYGAAPNGTGAYPPYAPQPSNQAEAKFIDYLLARERDAERKFEEFKKTLETQKGMDPFMMMALVNQARPEPIPWEKVIGEFRNARGGDPFSDSGRAPHAGTPIDPFAAAAATAPQSQPAVQGLVDLTGQVIAMAKEAQGKPAPVAPPAVPQKDAFEHPLVRDMFGALIEKSKTPAVDPLVAELRAEVRELKTAMAAASSKPTPTISQQLSDFVAMKKAMDEITGGGGAPTFMEQVSGIVEAVAENAEGIGKMFAQFGGKPPALPKSSDNKQLPAGAAPAAGAKKAAAPFPEAAKAAILKMRDAAPGEEGQDDVAGALYELIMALNGGGEPWNALANAIINGFLNADSRPELYALVTNLFARCGAKALAADGAMVDKVTAVLHRHYSLIYNQLSRGQDKKLADAETAVEPVAAPAAPATQVVEAKAEKTAPPAAASAVKAPPASAPATPPEPEPEHPVAPRSAESTGSAPEDDEGDDEDDVEEEERAAG